MNNARTQEDWYRFAPWIDDDAADIDAYVSRLKKNQLPGYDLKQKLTEWHDNGVVIFEGVVDKNLVDQVNADLDFVFRNHDKYHVVIDGSNEISEKYRFLDRLSGSQVRELNIRVVDFHTISYNAARLSMVPEAISFLGHVFGSQPALLQSLTFPIGSEQPLHQDFPYVFRQLELAKLAAFWIPLEDIHPDSGPLAYFCGSHKVSKLGFFDWGNGAINQYDRYGQADKFAPYDVFLKERIAALKLTPQHFLPKKGDLLIWHGALIHAGSRINNRNLTRKSFVGHYTTLGSHHAIRGHRLDSGFVFGVPGNKDIRNNQSGRGNRYLSMLERLKHLARRTFR